MQGPADVTHAMVLLGMETGCDRRQMCHRHLSAVPNQSQSCDTTISRPVREYPIFHGHAWCARGGWFPGFGM